MVLKLYDGCISLVGQYNIKGLAFMGIRRAVEMEYLGNNQMHLCSIIVLFSVYSRSGQSTACGLDQAY